MLVTTDIELKSATNLTSMKRLMPSSRALLMPLLKLYHHTMQTLLMLRLNLKLEMSRTMTEFLTTTQKSPPPFSKTPAPTSQASSSPTKTGELNSTHNHTKTFLGSLERSPMPNTPSTHGQTRKLNGSPMSSNLIPTTSSLLYRSLKSGEHPHSQNWPDAPHLPEASLMKKPSPLPKNSTASKKISRPTEQRPSQALTVSPQLLSSS